MLNHRLRPWLMWFLGAGFFFCEYFARVDPSVMIDKLMLVFNVHYAAVGGLSACFYYPYILMQLPVGMILDRYSTRLWLAAAALLSALGAVVFGGATALWMAKAGRILIGFGASFAFVGTMKIASMWFKPSRLGLMAGLTQASGMLGAAFGEGVFVYIVAFIGWRATLFLISAILLFFSVMIFGLVRDLAGAQSKRSARERSLFTGLRCVVTCRQNWWVALYAGLLYAPTAALAELWGVNFFHYMHHVPKTVAAMMMSLIFIGWTLGGPLVGWVSDRWNTVRIPMVVSALGSLFFLVAVIYIPSLTRFELMVCLLAYGVFNTGVAIAYAVAGRLHRRSIAGVSIAFTNMASIMIGALLQPILGWLLQQQWQHQMVNGLQYFKPIAYQRTLVVLPVCLLLALVCVFFISPSQMREKNE